MQRESYCGFHYISCFTQCWRRGFFKYIMKWVPEFVAPALNEGAAIHEGIAEFYLTGDEQKAFAKAMDAISERKELYEYPEKWMDGYKRVMLIMEGWLGEYAGKTFNQFKVLHVEEPREILLNNSNYLITIRPDAELLNLETGEILIPDIKTSSYSLDSIYYSYESSQQGTFYLWGLRQLPEYEGKILTTFPDAIYQKFSKVTCERKQKIYRTNEEIEEFEVELKSHLDDLTARVEGFQSKPCCSSVNYFFPRQGTCDGGQAWHCEYKGICRFRVDPLNEEYVPLGFKKDDRPFKDILLESESV